ncbi:MAG: hypothetical protein HYY25_15140 [Candidatus Wallbacteria bacterium]|nr:hypothetical protein [Candidatus Wallbacteria bacterium]
MGCQEETSIRKGFSRSDPGAMRDVGHDRRSSGRIAVEPVALKVGMDKGKMAFLRGSAVAGRATRLSRRLDLAFGGNAIIQQGDKGLKIK